MFIGKHAKGKSKYFLEMCSSGLYLYLFDSKWRYSLVDISGKLSERQTEWGATPGLVWVSVEPAYIYVAWIFVRLRSYYVSRGHSQSLLSIHTEPLTSATMENMTNLVFTFSPTIHNKTKKKFAYRVYFLLCQGSEQEMELGTCLTQLWFPVQPTFSLGLVYFPFLKSAVLFQFIFAFWLQGILRW